MKRRMRRNPVPSMRGAEEIIYRPIYPESAGTCTRLNPAKRTKRIVDPCADVYQGHEELLVRTALVRSEDFDKGEEVIISSSRNVAKLLNHLTYSDVEYVVVLALNAKGRVVAISEISIGGIDSAPVEARHAIKVTLLTGARAFILAHNHPAGDPSPSHEDVKITEVVKRAAECMDIAMVDHVIVARGGYFSFLDKGLLK